MEHLLRAHDVAKILNLKPSTVYELAQRGVLPHVRLTEGRRRPIVRFARATIETFLQDRTVPPRGAGSAAR